MPSFGHARAAGRTVGVIAVDPSSPISGGAILGDRIRMTAALDDDGVFVRSLASRGYLGGLSPAAVRVIDALDAAGFDLVLLETVGTGQSEMDVAEVADVRVVITAPGLGDDIQAMKSGLLEIADVLVVNKGDREGAEMTLQQLIGALSIRVDARQGAGAQDDGDHRRGRAGARHDRRRHRRKEGAGGRPLTPATPRPLSHCARCGRHRRASRQGRRGTNHRGSCRRGAVGPSHARQGGEETARRLKRQRVQSVALHPFDKVWMDGLNHEGTLHAH